MSVITDMIVYINDDEIEAIKELDRWCFENDKDRQQWFKDINTDDAGGTKYFTSYILAMAGNYFPYKELIEVFWTFPWRNPKKVVLIVNHENEESLMVISYKDKAE